MSITVHELLLDRQPEPVLSCQEEFKGDLHLLDPSRVSSWFPHTNCQLGNKSDLRLHVQALRAPNAAFPTPTS